MENELNKNDDYKAWIIWSGIVLIVWAVSYPLISWIIDGAKPTRGEFGDTYGAVNSLFSGLAFAGIIFTIILQRKELRLQRLELTETRNELKRSADAQEKSQAALNDQIRMMQLTAQLNAMNSLVEAYNAEIQTLKEYQPRYRDLKGKIGHYLKRIEDNL